MSRMVSDEVLQRFTRAWGDGELACEVARKLTCSESDALVELFRALGVEDLAHIWESEHAEGDAPEDLHYADPSA
jgi:hypothetical protein